MDSSPQSKVESWQSAAIERLLPSQSDSGGWGYRHGSTAATEPTALVSIALSHGDADPSVPRRATEWLAGAQHVDGSVPVYNNMDVAFWPTSLAILAWKRAAGDRSRYEKSQITRAVNWLLKLRGDAFPPAPSIFGHDTRLVGWPWVAETHSWIEPTAYAIRALCESGLRNHRRVLEGIELILDRTLPEGGWNYGNTRVLAHTLRPFPATTGIALYGLAGEQRDARIERSIEFLKNAVLELNAPWSLSWGLIGLSAWNAVPPQAPALLEKCAEALEDRDPNVLDDALMLWAYAMVSKSTGKANES